MICAKLLPITLVRLAPSTLRVRFRCMVHLVYPRPLLFQTPFLIAGQCPGSPNPSRTVQASSSNQDRTATELRLTQPLLPM